MTEKTNKDLAGKSALITGASRGIGRSLAIAFARRGAHIYAIARTVGALEELDDAIQEAGGSASLIPVDLLVGNAVEDIAGALSQRLEKLEFLVLNAAILGELAPVQDIAPRSWNAVMELNVTVNWRFLRAFHPFLAAADRAQIIGLTSRVGGEHARAYWGSYAVSKAGFEMLLQTFAEENTAFDMGVTIIDPGAMRTSMRAEAMPGENPETLPSPDEIIPLIDEIIDTGKNAPRRIAFRDWKS